MNVNKEAAKLVAKLISRWSTRSPKAGVYITNIALVVGIVAIAIPFVPVVVPALVLPIWAVPAASFTTAFIAKLTVETPEIKSDPEKED